MAQPQPQPQNQTPKGPPDPLAGFEPGPHTYWLLQHNAGIERDAKLAIVDRFGVAPGKIVSVLQCAWLSDRHTIAPIFVDPYEPVRENGRLRARRNKQTKEHDRDPVNLKFGAPIALADLASFAEDTGAVSIQIRNAANRPGLLTLIERACRRRNENGKEVPCVTARYRTEDGGSITLTNV